MATSEKRNNNYSNAYFLDLDYSFVVGENGTIPKTMTGGEPITAIGEETNLVLSFNLE